LPSEFLFTAEFHPGWSVGWALRYEGEDSIASLKIGIHPGVSEQNPLFLIIIDFIEKPKKNCDFAGGRLRGGESKPALESG
jgi:hypothetical protein